MNTYNLNVAGHVTAADAGSGVNVGDLFSLSITFPDPMPIWFIPDSDGAFGLSPGGAAGHGSIAIGSFSWASDFITNFGDHSNFDFFHAGTPAAGMYLTVNFYDSTGNLLNNLATQEDVLHAVASNFGSFESIFNFEAANGSQASGILTGIDYPAAALPDSGGTGVLLAFACIAAIGIGRLQVKLWKPA